MSEENLAMPTPTTQSQLPSPRLPMAAAGREVFDERAYLNANPDVASAILRGEVSSAYEHYRTYGIREGRDLRYSDGKAQKPANPIGEANPPNRSGASPLQNTFETLFVSPDGAVAIMGWADDVDDAIEWVGVSGPNWRVRIDGASLARSRRIDVEDALGSNRPHPFGYLGLVFGAKAISIGDGCHVEMRLASGAMISGTVRPQIFDIEEIRNRVVLSLAEASHFGNPHVRAIAALEHGLGDQIVALNRYVVGQITSSPYVERFGEAGSELHGSIVVCLYGKVEFFFLQMALYSRLPGIDAYEFIYVCNSPELSEALLNEARVAALIYGLPVTVVILAGNAGFGAANNAAAALARTDRLLFVNPDVFPKDPDWASKHTALLQSPPAAETRLFGAPLYYDDGSLMHGGMFFELDTGVAFKGRKSAAWSLLRVEHYGKGAPADRNPFTRPRPVPAVTGAFISIQRSWFERLGGFSLDYVFGHYEDADLCLKSLTQGVAPFLHDIRLWHMEGKGSARLPVHDYGSLLNRWLFSTRWGAICQDGLLGPSPTHHSLSAPGVDHQDERLGATRSSIIDEIRRVEPAR